MKKRRLTALLAGVVLTMATFLTGCTDESPVEADKKQEEASGDKKEEQKEDKKEDSAKAPVAADDVTVGVSINALDAINNRQIFDLMQQKVEAAGYECISTNANGTAVQQSTDIENLVQQGCDVIVVMNGDTDGLTNAVKEASEKGVHIISVESGFIPGISAYFAKNDFALGATMYMKLILILATADIPENVCRFWCIRKESAERNSVSEKPFLMWGLRSVVSWGRRLRRTASPSGRQKIKTA